MQIKYPPLINVVAEVKGAKFLLGKVIVNAEVKGKTAELVLDRDEAVRLHGQLAVALGL